MKWFKQLICNHEYTYVKTSYGIRVSFTNSDVIKISRYKCSKCNKVKDDNRINNMKDKIIVHTQNKYTGEGYYPVRFGSSYSPEYENTDRLTIVGLLDSENKEMRVGLAFCTNGDNFSRRLGTFYAEMKAQSLGTGRDRFKPYTVVRFTEEEFTLKNTLDYLYSLHEDLVSLSVKEVKKEVAKQIVK